MMKKWTALLLMLAMLLCFAGAVAEETCAHANTLAQETYTAVHESMEEPNPLYHLCRLTYYNVTTCEDCGEEVSREQATEYTEWYSHWWTNAGVCGYCGQENTCPHTGATYTVEREKNPVTTSDGSTRYHQVTYEQCVDTFCIDCDVRIGSEPLDPATITYTIEHSWNEDNVCTDCGFVSTCQHVNTYKQENYRAEYVQVDDPMYHDRHYVFYYTVNCDDCGKLGVAPEEFIEEYTERGEHTWNPEGVCRGCQKVNDCPHETLEPEHTYQTNWHFVQIEGDALQHAEAYDVYAYMTCQTCGMYQQEPVYLETVQSGWITNHYWNDDGLCRDCSYVNTCLHEGSSSIYRETMNERYEDSGTRYHTYSYDWYDVTRCDTCNMRIETAYQYTSSYEWEHNWNYENTCWDCGRVNNCEHTGSEYSSEMWMGHRYRSIDDLRQHEFIVDVYNVYYCNDCGVQKRQEYVRTETSLENHGWGDNGESILCWNCKQINTCVHDGEMETNQWDGGRTYEPSETPGYHNCLVEIWQDKICATCGYYFGNELANVETRLEPHYYYYGDGVCSGCGETCAHGNTYTNPVQDGHQWVNVDKQEYHEYHYQEYNDTYCSDCGMLVKRELIQEHADQYSHAWNDSGVCSACGFVNTCEHVNTYISTGTPTAFYEKAQEAGHHYYTEEVVEYTYCSDCAMEVAEKNMGMRRTLQAHDYMPAGECACGVVDGACQHPNAQQTGGNPKYTTFEKIDDTKHSYSFDVYWEYTCPDCEAEYEVYIERGTEEEEHHFGSDNLCQQCGAVKNTCDHFWVNGICRTCGAACPHGGESYITTVQTDREHVNVGSNSYHEYRYNVYTAECCVTCGGVIELMGLESEGNVMQVGHAWDENGYCEPCGKHNSCAHLTTTETYKRGDEFYERAQETGSHYYTVEYINYEYCKTCMLTLWEKTSSVERELQAHSYDESGVCVCGAVQSACQHPNAEQTGGRQKYKTFVNLGDTEHSYSFDVYWKYSCPDCGESYEVYIERGTETDSHHFNEIGACECGAWCNHLNSTELSREMVPTTVEQIEGDAGAAFHKQHYNEEITSKCHDCGQEYTLSFGRVSDEGHTYDENGLCACGVTGAPTTCAHEHTEIQQYEVQLGYTYDNTYHTRSYDVYEGVWCTDCQSYRSRVRIYENSSTTSGHTLVNCACVCGYTVEPCETHSWSNGVCYVCGLIDCENHTWIDGVCDTCGQACAHANETFTGSGRQEQLGCTNNGDGTHTRTFKVFYTYNCPDCAYTYDKYMEDGSETEAHVFNSEGVCVTEGCGAQKPVCENHTWIDGVCDTCGEACDHSNSEYLRNEEVLGNLVSQGDPLYHEQLYVDTYTYQCRVCQHTYSLVYNMVREEAHTYNENGVCACGVTGGEPTTCGHENVEYKTYEVEIGYSDLTDGSHVYKYNLFGGMWCDDCETYRTRVLDTPELSRSEEHTYVNCACVCGNMVEPCTSHSWSNGVCSVCGTACTHTGLTWVSERKDNIRYEQLDDGNHRQYYDLYWTYQCTDCGLLQENYEGYTYTEEGHTFENGACTFCGWTDQTCQHANQQQYTSSENYEYEDLNDREHSYTYDVYDIVQCTDCWETLSRTLRERTGSTGWHNWVEHDDGTKSCDACGRVNTCDHSGERETYTNTTNYSYAQNGDLRYHAVSYDEYAQILCANCRVQTAYDYVRTVESQEQHVWNEGVCVICNQANSCTHEVGTYTSEVGTEGGWESTGDLKYHTYTYNVRIDYFCEGCSLLLRSEQGEPHVEQQYHDWNDEGVCWACKQENACEHNNTNTYDSEWTIDFEECDDLRYHTYMYELHRIKDCLDCGAQLENENLGLKSKRTEHWWNDVDGKRVCGGCGQENTCAHANRYTQEENDGWTFESIDLRYHTETYDRYLVEYCSDCGDRTKETFIEQQTGISQHWWNESNDKYICGGCRMENTCAHTETETERRTDNWKYEQIDNPREHKATYNVYSQEVCVDCGLEIGERKSLGEESGNYLHSWNAEGVCRDCAQETSCQHESQEVQYWRYNSTYKKLDDQNQHEVTYEKREVTVCLDCSAQLNSVSMGMVTENENHWWSEVGGKLICGNCLMENTCEHANLDSWTWNDFKHCVSTGDPTYHNRVYDVYLMTECLDCGRYTEKIDGEATERQTHNWNDEGVCTACNQENACEHTLTTNSIRNNNHVSSAYDNPGLHKTVYDVELVTECRVCHTEISVEKLEERTRYDAHDWYEQEDGTLACYVCNQVNTCEHTKTNQRVSEETLEYRTDGADAHIVTKRADIEIYCELCKQTVSVTEGSVVEVRESHNWDGEKCDDCDEPNTCTHADAVTRTSYSYSNYENLGDEGHSVTVRTYTYERCYVCDWRSDRTLVSTETITEAHEEDEECECGYINPCTHENKFTDTWYTSTTCEPLDDKRHDCKGYLVTMEICVDCNAQISRTISKTLEQYDVENHWFNEYGQCEGCSYEKTTECQHLNTAVMTDVMSNDTAVSVNDKMHAFDRIKYTYTSCLDCGENLGNIQNVETVTSYEEHYYNDYGFCYECSHKNTCAHDGGVEEEVQPDEWTSIQMVDDKYHKLIGTVVTYKWCELCGQELDYTVSEHGEYLLEHMMEEGACMECEYTQGCAHEHTMTVEEVEYGWALYCIPVDENGHKAVYETWRYTVCEDCRIILWSYGSVKVGEVQVDEAHTLEDGFCAQCGYTVPVCSHTNSTEQGYEMIEGAPVQQDPPHPTYHLQPYSVIFTYLCNDCGETYTRSNDMAGEAAHDYVTYDETAGLWVCACGATSDVQTTCQHENKEYRTYGIDEYRMLDSETHEHKYNVYGGMWCLDCQSFRTKQLETPGEALIEAHVFNDDADTDCNYCIYIREVTDSRKVLKLPEGLTAIETEAFMGVTTFTHIVVPESVKSIGLDAFERGTIIVAPTDSFAHHWAVNNGYMFESLEE